MKRVFLLIFIIFVFACEQQETSQKKSKKSPAKESLTSVNSTESFNINAKKVKLIDSLIDIQTINPSIQVDLKYASSDNFMHMRLYERISRAFLQKDVALRLSKVQELLEKMKPGYRLLVYDAVRPVSVQRKMWNALDTIPIVERGKFVSNPDNRSLHNLGAAVDLTIIDDNLSPLDMGAGYDDIRKIAYPILEKEFLAKGELTQTQVANRELLRQVMKSQGFRPLDTEWWHFNACSRPLGLAKYKVLLVEP